MASQAKEQVTFMRGGGHYNQNSTLQQAAIAQLFKYFPDLQHSENVTVADYGSATGFNSVFAIEKLLATLPNGSSASVTYNDRPENDFSELALCIRDTAPTITRNGEITLVSLMSPISFYKPSVPTNSIDVGLCFSSLHYLQKQELSGQKSRTFANTDDEIFAAAAHEDLVQFLRLRAAEIKSGGTLLACMPAAREDPSNLLCKEAVKNSLVGMIREGKVPASAVSKMRPAVFARKLHQVEAVLADTVDHWEKVACWNNFVELPGFAKVEAAKQSGDEANHLQASRDWAKACAGWFVSVLGGFLMQAVRVEKFGNEAYDRSSDEDSIEKSILDEWHIRLEQTMLQDARDVEFRLDYVFFCLRRK